MKAYLNIALVAVFFFSTTASAVASNIRSGPVEGVTITDDVLIDWTVPEGFTLRDVAERLTGFPDLSIDERVDLILRENGLESESEIKVGDTLTIVLSRSTKVVSPDSHEARHVAPGIDAYPVSLTHESGHLLSASHDVADGADDEAEGVLVGAQEQDEMPAWLFLLGVVILAAIAAPWLIPNVGPKSSAEL